MARVLERRDGRVVIWALLAAAAVLAWYVWPFVLLWRLPLADKPRQGLTREVRRAAALSMLKAIPKSIPVGICSFPPVAILAVAVALIPWITPRSADKLPWLFTFWDNDVSINGDKPEYWDPAYAGVTYYADAHPRSYWARFVWLGVRNRASRLSQMLGHRWTDKDAPSATWGYAGVDANEPGWAVHEKEGQYQLVYIRMFGPHWRYHLTWGHKIWAKIDRRPVANVIASSASLNWHLT